MHHPLSSLSRRVILDTNVLLDAAFVEDGVARRAVALLNTLEFSPVIDDMIEREATKILQRYTIQLALTFDAGQVLDRFIRDFHILRLPPAPPLPAPKVNRKDQHIARAAQHYGGWVLSGDVELVVQCEASRIPARFPWDVIMEKAVAKGGELKLDQVIRVVPPSRERGVIFGRVIPGGWAATNSVGQFTMCDVENVGRVFYDTHTQEWAFEMAIGITARVKSPLKKEEVWAVCGSYQLPGSFKRGSVTIRAGRDALTRHTKREPTMKQITSLSVGQMSFGHSVRGHDYWNGPLRAIVVGPQGMSDDSWKAITATPEGAPNPYDANALERVLRAAQLLRDATMPALMRLPTEQDLLP